MITLNSNAELKSFIFEAIDESPTILEIRKDIGQVKSEQANMRSELTGMRSELNEMRCEQAQMRSDISRNAILLEDVDSKLNTVLEILLAQIDSANASKRKIEKLDEIEENLDITKTSLREHIRDKAIHVTKRSAIKYI